MNFKTLISAFIATFSLVFIACDDDVKTVGNDIQPDGDKVSLLADTVYLTAETVSFDDKVYARTHYGTLGQLNDPILGPIKSEFLCEFFVSNEFKFKDNLVSIDSSSVTVLFRSTKAGYVGDSTALMGASIYKLNKDLNRVFYTNVDPANYCDISQGPIATTTYSVKGIPAVSGVRALSIKLDTVDMGRRIYNEWLNDKTIFDSPTAFRKVLKGLYVANTLGTGSLLNVEQTYFNIFYSYNVRNTANTADSLVSTAISFPATADVIQLNSVKNAQAGIDALLTPVIDASKKERTFVKTPAGVYTKLHIPIGEIAQIRAQGYNVLNAANFTLKGYTELESDMKMENPTTLLCVPQDSLANYFESGKTPTTDATSFVVYRTESTNSYSFGNLAGYIDYYINKLTENGATIDPTAKLTYCVIPVEVKGYTNTSTSVYVYESVSNTMRPTGAVFRTDPENLKMSVIQTKFAP